MKPQNEQLSSSIFDAMCQKFDLTSALVFRRIRVINPDPFCVPCRHRDRLIDLPANIGAAHSQKPLPCHSCYYTNSFIPSRTVYNPNNTVIKTLRPTRRRLLNSVSLDFCLRAAQGLQEASHLGCGGPEDGKRLHDSLKIFVN